MKSQPEFCPICEKGTLFHQVEQREIEVDGVRLMAALHYHECDSCGSQIGTATDTLTNKQIMIEACRKVRGESER